MGLSSGRCVMALVALSLLLATSCQAAKDSGDEANRGWSGSVLDHTPCCVACAATEPPLPCCPAGCGPLGLLLRFGLACAGAEELPQVLGASHADATASRRLLRE